MKKLFKTVQTTPFTWQSILPYYLVFAAIMGLIGSMILSVEKLRVVADPLYSPSCSINPVLSCGSVMLDPSAEAFGIPHSFFGLAIFGALLALGVLMLAGGKFANWLWYIATAISLAGFFGIMYLIYQSVFVIGSLCPWCMVVWVVSVPVFVGISVYTIREIVPTKSVPEHFRPITQFIDRHNSDLLFGWFLAIVCIVAWKFWYYWSTLL
jgi:uncharacterized membrane protein